VTSLNAGSLPNAAFVGEVPLSGDRVYQFSPQTSYQSLVDIRAAYQRSGFYTPTVELGISPVGGALDPTLAGGWGLYGQAGISILEGENVETNNHLIFALSLNRQIDNPNFTFMTVGPAFSFEHYAQNEDFFTFGHGGYFSPDYIFQGAVAFRFLTKEARSYLLKGEVLAGLQTYKQDAAPDLPARTFGGQLPWNQC
jgi:hypothetical protein